VSPVVCRREWWALVDAYPPEAAGGTFSGGDMATRTTHRSTAGKKLYAVRDKKGQFKDIKTYAREHAPSIKRKARKSK
jgi:hypothetical protein